MFLVPVLFAILPAPLTSSNKPHLASSSPPPLLASPPAAVVHFHLPSSLDLQLAAAEAQPGSDERSAFLENWSESLTGDELLSTLENLSPKEGSTVSELSHLLVARLAQLSPAQAAQWLADNPNVPDRHAFLTQISSAWADSDLVAALRWSTTLPPDQRQGVLLDIGYETARTNPKDALSIASTLPPSPERDTLLSFAASQWAASDFGTAAQWAQQVPDQSLRQELLASIAVASAKQDPGTAAALAATELQDQSVKARAQVAIVQRWAELDPEQAATWVAQLTESPAESEAAWNLVTLWASHDKATAAAWIQTLPLGPLRDSALQALTAAPTPP